MTSYEWPYGPPTQMSMPTKPARPGVETRQVLLSLGALCLIVAFSAGTALVWGALGAGGQIALMAGVTLALLAGAATLRKLPATAEALAAVGLVGCAIDAIAAHTLHISLATQLPVHLYLDLAALAIVGVSVCLLAAAPALVSPRIAGCAAAAVGMVDVVIESLVNQDPVPDYALALAAAAIVAGWPRSRRDSAPVRNTALTTTALLASIANGITLSLHNVSTPEAYLATPAGCALAWGAAVLYRTRAAKSVVLLPGLAGLLPTFLMALGTDHERQAVMLVAATILVVLGAEFRLSTPLTVGAWIIGLLGLRLVGPQLALMPHWIMWGAAGTILLTLGATWEARLADAHRLSDVLRPQLAKLR